MRTLLHTLLLSLLLVSQRAEAQSFNPAVSATLQSVLDSLVTMFADTRGMSAAVYVPGQGLWQGSSGISHAGQPITPQMQFGIASNTKLFTAAALLKLAEAGKLYLDDSLHEWLPTYPNIDSAITIRQLLNHTSGISDPFASTHLLEIIDKFPDRRFTPEEIIALVGPKLFAPGAGYGYSNTNYILAGMVAEQATGQHISSIIRDHLLTPLQLGSTFYDGEETAPGIIAHRWQKGTDYHDTSRISLNTSGGPAGALFSTSSEMVQWYHALMSGLVLDSASFRELTTFAAPGNYGLGLGTFTFFSKPCWGHGGSTHGYKSRMIYDPCTEVVVCGLSNSNPSAVDGITAMLYKVLVDYLPACPGVISGDAIVCQGQQGAIYSIPPIANASSYLWLLPNGITGSSTKNMIHVDVAENATSGTITVRGSNMYGTGPLATFAVAVQPTPAPATVSRNGNVLHSSAPIGNQWHDGNGMIAGATEQDYAVTTDGRYYTIVTLDGCSSDTSNIVAVVLASVEHVPNHDAILLYPNPAGNQLVLAPDNLNLNRRFEIISSGGKLAFKGNLDAGHVVQIGSLVPGVYFLRFDDGRMFKFVKQ